MERSHRCLPFAVSLGLLICASGEAALAQSSHPYCQQYAQYCRQVGQPYCQQYQQYCASGRGGGSTGRFRAETLAWRFSVGATGYVGTQSGFAISPGGTVGPVISRVSGTSDTWRFRGIQLIPEIGMYGLVPFAEAGDRLQWSFNGLIGLRSLWGFGGTSLGASGHLVIGGIRLYEADRDVDVVAFTLGLRVGADVAFANGTLGFELAYVLLTEFMEELINSFVLSFYFDVFKVFIAIGRCLQRL